MVQAPPPQQAYNPTYYQPPLTTSQNQPIPNHQPYAPPSNYAPQVPVYAPPPAPVQSYNPPNNYNNSGPLRDLSEIDNKINNVLQRTQDTLRNMN